MLEFMLLPLGGVALATSSIKVFRTAIMVHFYFLDIKLGLCHLQQTPANCKFVLQTFVCPGLKAPKMNLLYVE